MNDPHQREKDCNAWLAHKGRGARITTGKPVTGCSKVKLSAWSSWQLYTLPFHSYTPSYFTSPLIGIPRYWQCKRIWCVLPLRGYALTTISSFFSLKSIIDFSSTTITFSSFSSSDKSLEQHCPFTDNTSNKVSMSLIADPPGSFLPTSDSAYTRQAPNFDRPWPDLMLMHRHFGAAPVQKAMYVFLTLWSVKALTSLAATLCDLVINITPLVSRSSLLARWSSGRFTWVSEKSKLWTQFRTQRNSICKQKT